MIVIKFLKKLLAFVLLYLVSSYCQAQSSHIVTNTNDSGLGSLRQAIIDATSFDTIRLDNSLIANGNDTIVLSSEINFNKSLVIKGVFNSTDTLFISGNDTTRVFKVEGAVNKVVFDSLVIINGLGAISVGADSIFVINTIIKNHQNRGIAVASYIHNSMSFNVINSTIENNQNGGIAVADETTKVNIMNSSITNNYAQYGGGISSSSLDITIENSILDSNYAVLGGGLYTSVGLPRIKLINSIVSNNSALNYGGGIFARTAYSSSAAAHFLIENSSIINNSSIRTGSSIISKGGGIYCVAQRSYLDINNSDISNNLAVEGGGIYCTAYSYITMTNSLINSNTAINNGGGIFSESIRDFDINNCTLNNNIANNGGGIYTYQSSNLGFIPNFLVRNSTISNNTAINNGGGIYNSTFCNVINSSIYDNTADNGGGIYDSVYHLYIDNSTINNNLATNDGGGVYSTKFNTLKLTNTTICNNSALNNGGGLFTSTQSNYLWFDIKNTTISNNSANNNGSGLYTSFFNNIPKVNVTSSIIWTDINHGSNIFDNDSLSINSQGYNIFSDSVLSNIATGDQFNVSALDLNLEPLGNYGGLTETMIPGINSIAINVGNPNDSSSAQNKPILGIRDIGAAENNCNEYKTEEVAVCNSYTWRNGVTYTTSVSEETFVVNGVASGGCDSIYYLNLTINSSYYVDEHIACDSFVWIDGVTYISSNNTAQHTLTNSLGCDSIITLNLIINTSDNIIDTHSSCSPFIWVDGNTYTDNNNTATHVLYNSNGCDSIITLDLTIHDIDLTTSIIQGTISANESGSEYQWLNCDSNYYIIENEINQTFIPHVDGNYSVEITNSFGCIDTTDCILVDFTEVSESLLRTINIHPNPNNGYFVVHYPNSVINETKIVISNLFGQIIQELSLFNDKASVDISDLQKGFYFVKVVERGVEKSIVKVVKN